MPSTLILGDSIVKELSGINDDASVISLSGYKIHQVLPVAVECAPFFNSMVLTVGTNNIPTNCHVEMLVSTYEDLLISVLHKNPDIEIIVSGILPRFQDLWKLYRQDREHLNSKAVEFNQKLKNPVCPLQCNVHRPLVSV